MSRDRSGDEDPRWGQGQVVQRRRTDYYYHVVNRYRDIDDGHVLYRLTSPTHTGYEYIREEDAIHEYESAGFRLPTSVKPAAVFGHRVEGILYGYNERPHEPVTDGGREQHTAETDSEMYCPDCGQFHTVDAHLSNGGEARAE